MNLFEKAALVMHEVLQPEQSPWCFLSLPVELREKLYDWQVVLFQDADLVQNLHVTLLSQVDAGELELVREIAEKHLPLRAAIAGVRCFKTPDADVMVLDVTSDEIVALQRELAERVESSSVGTQFIPHISLAYLPKGDGAEYDDLDLTGLYGTRFDVTSLVFDAVVAEHVVTPAVKHSGMMTKSPTGTDGDGDGMIYDGTPNEQPAPKKSGGHEDHVSNARKAMAELERMDDLTGDDFDGDEFVRLDDLLWSEVDKVTERRDGESDKDYLKRMHKGADDTMMEYKKTKSGIELKMMHRFRSARDKAQKEQDAPKRAEREAAAKASAEKKQKKLESQVEDVQESNPEYVKALSIDAVMARNGFDLKRGIPKFRGEVTEGKIVSTMKKLGPSSSGEVLFNREIVKYESPEDLAEHMFYHGSPGGISGLMPSKAMKEGEFNGSGGYGEQYWGVSLSQDKAIASEFTGTSRSGSVAPVLLKKGARIVNMDISDANEVEEHITKLWKNGVDAVQIGSWKSGVPSEKELLILNTNAIVVGKPQGFMVKGKPKFKNLTPEEIQDMYANAVDNYEDAGGKNGDKLRKFEEQRDEYLADKSDVIDSMWKSAGSDNQWMNAGESLFD